LRALSERIVVRGSAWRAAIWTSRKSTPASSMVVTKVWRSMCGCGLVIRTPAVSTRRPRRRAAAWRSHPGAAAVEQDRAAGVGAYGLVDGPADGWWQRDEDDFGALAEYVQGPVAVFFAEVGDVSAGGFEDAQAEEPEHGDQGEVARVR
jgi:hypothetical protein